LKKLKGPVYLFLAFTLAGTSVISARVVTGTLGMFAIAAVSLFFALLFLLPLCLRRVSRAIGTLFLRDYLHLAAQALFGIFFFRVCLLYGLLYTSAGEAGLLTGATPAFTALLAMVVLKEPTGLRKLAGILGTVAGILLIQGLLTEGLSAQHMTGNLLVLAAAACEAVFNILSRVMSTGREPEKQMNPIVQTTLVTAIAFFLCLPPALMEPTLKNLASLELVEWLALIWYGVIVTAVAFICWYAGIKRCGAMTAAAFSGMMPFTSMLLSVFLLGERSGWPQWTGGALVIAGMAVIGSGGMTAEINKTPLKKGVG
jgi:drug/metabolite transporter (DMT)-like permease